MAHNPYFAFKQFTVHQGNSGMKVTTDACLLGATVAAQLATAQPTQLLDIGAGTGLLSLMLAQQLVPECSQGHITAVELDSAAAIQAQQNFADTPWQQNFTVSHQSIQAFVNNTTQHFDCIISNPPFFERSSKGHDAQRNQARHTDTLSFDELAQAIAKLLHDDGQSWLLLPTHNSAHFVTCAASHQLYLQQQIAVATNEQRPPHCHILQFSKQCCDQVAESTLPIYAQHPQYSPQTIALIQPYYRFL